MAPTLETAYVCPLHSKRQAFPTFAFLMTICPEPITRAEIARLHHLNKSTLTRDLKTLLSAGWIEEIREGANGRSRPLALTTAGKELVLNAQQASLSAQIQVVALLGMDGVNALTALANRMESVLNGLRRQIRSWAARPISPSRCGTRSRPTSAEFRQACHSVQFCTLGKEPTHGSIAYLGGTSRVRHVREPLSHPPSSGGAAQDG